MKKYYQFVSAIFSFVFDRKKIINLIPIMGGLLVVYTTESSVLSLVGALFVFYLLFYIINNDSKK